MLIPDLDLARRFLVAEAPPGRLLQCGLTGGHYYGFPSPDSDLDLKGVHLAPTAAVLGLHPVGETHDRLVKDFEGAECDLTTHEARKALSLLLRGNGNLLERLLSPVQLVEGPAVEALQALARGTLSLRFFHHYAGYFGGMCREHTREGSTKSLLYSYRVALTGAHLLRAGEVVGDVGILGPEYGFPEVAELIVAKREGGEHGALDPALSAAGQAHWPALQALLHTARDESDLPAEPANVEACHQWLIQTRMAAT